MPTWRFEVQKPDPRPDFEAKVNPAGDLNMRVDWFIDGKPLAVSSRVTVTYRFGYISLLITAESSARTVECTHAG